MSAGHGDAIRALLPGCSDAVLDACSETGVNADDVRSDIHRIRTGASTREQLTELVMDGADPDRVEAWHDYVAAVCAIAVQS